MISSRTTTKRPAGATGIPITPARRKTRSPRNWRPTSHGARGSIAVPRPGSSPASAKQAQLLGCDPHHADLLIARASGFLFADPRSAPSRSTGISALVVYRGTADVVIGLNSASVSNARARRQPVYDALALPLAFDQAGDARLDRCCLATVGLQLATAARAATSNSALSQRPQHLHPRRVCEQGERHHCCTDLLRPPPRSVASLTSRVSASCASAGSDARCTRNSTRPSNRR
jgi:hypothetical protein